MEKIPIRVGDREVSHLAVRLDTLQPVRQPPLCFLYLHGLGSDQSGEKADFFRQQALEAGFAFCSFDFQGHGQSGGQLRDMDLTRNLDDVARVHAWLGERGYERLCLIGSSMGGGIGVWYAALHPEAVVAGLHIAPALELEQGLLKWAGPERARQWQETGVIHFQNDFVSTDLAWSLIEDLRRYRMDDLRSRYCTPTLILQGRHDDSVPWRGVVEFATHCAFGGIDLHLFADGDHRLTDRKERMWDLMLEFLRGRRLLAQ